MIRKLRSLFRSWRKKQFPYSPLIAVLISKEAILHNLHLFQTKHPKLSIAPVLKSNAYGHGLIEVAHILENETLPFLCVDSYFEALILRNEGIAAPILIIGYTPIETIETNDLPNVTFGIIGQDDLYDLCMNTRTPVSIHLKVDTGMHRHGISLAEIDEASAMIRANPRIHLEGVYSHLADADTKDSGHTDTQIQEWNRVIRQLRAEFPSLAYAHCSATAGTLYSEKIEANVMRLGLGLYGINSGPAALDLRPALQMKTRISSLRVIEKGGAVGYNGTFVAESRMRIASIPAGYYEGIDRRLSNKGSVLVRDTPCAILGRVSMNITSIDVSAFSDLEVGEQVTLISSDARAPNSVEQIATLCGTIPYEILVRIPGHLRRVV